MKRAAQPAHRWEYILSIVLTFLMTVAVVTLTFLYIAGTAQGSIFKVKVAYLLEKYETQATPADWTFILLYMILMYQLIWLIYGITTLATRTKGGYLYYCPLYMPMGIYIFYLIGISLFLAHIYLWDAENMLAALACIALSTISCYVSAWISYVYLDRYESDLRRDGLKREIAHVRGMVQNGIELLCSWCGVICLVLLASCLKDKRSMTDENASTLSLCLLAGSILFLGIFNIYVLAKYLCFTFAPYIVFLVYLCGVLVRHEDYGWNRNNIITLVLLIVLILLFIVKILAVMWKTQCCGRYCGCMPSLSCNQDGSCFDCQPVEEECPQPVKRKPSTKKVAVAFKDEAEATTTFCEDEPPRQVLNAPMTLPPPQPRRVITCVRPAAPRCVSRPMYCSEPREVLNAPPGNQGGYRNGGYVAQPRASMNTFMVRPPVQRVIQPRNY